jgi:hypothetical protein
VHAVSIAKFSFDVIITKCIFAVSIATRLHRKKSFSIFPSPAWMSLTKLSLDGNYDVIYKLFLLRESLVSDIQAGDGNIESFFTV